MTAMDDKRLEYLLKLATEAEDLERSAAEPVLRLVEAAPRQRRWLLPVAGAMAAAAAAVVVITVVLPAMNQATRPKGPIAGTGSGAPTGPMIVPGDFSNPLGSPKTDESSVVLAFFEGFDGRCSCLHIQDEEWNGEQLATKDRSELLDVAMSSRCSTPSPKILVVAISGQRDALPRSPEQAEALAAHLSDYTSRSDLTDRAYQAVSGLPAGTKVVAESYGNRSSILDHAKWSIR
jgi:hypothetical protein